MVHTESLIPAAMTGVTGLPLLGRSGTLIALRLRESNYLLPGPASRAGISAFRRTHRRKPSPGDRGGWRIPQRNPEVDRIPCIRSKQRAGACCAYFIHAIEGHHPGGGVRGIAGLWPLLPPSPPGAGWTEPPHGANDPDP